MLGFGNAPRIKFHGASWKKATGFRRRKYAIKLYLSGPCALFLRIRKPPATSIAEFSMNTGM